MVSLMPHLMTSTLLQPEADVVEELLSLNMP